MGLGLSLQGPRRGAGTGGHTLNTLAHGSVTIQSNEYMTDPMHYSVSFC